MQIFPSIQSRTMLLYNNFFPANITTFTSDRTIDFKLDQTQCSLSATQKEYLSSQLNFDLPEPIHIQQVHGNRVIVADQSFPQREMKLEDADGLITRDLYLPLAIRTADCLPVFLYDEKNSGIGLLHVGWKSLQKNIIIKAIDLMNKEWHAEPKDIKVIFGPSIRACCFEVDEQFGDYFSGQIISRDNQYYFDSPQFSHDQLCRLGVMKENIFDCNICTCCNKNYFSFREEKEQAGKKLLYNSIVLDWIEGNICILFFDDNRFFGRRQFFNIP